MSDQHVKVLHVLNVLRPSGAETTLMVAGPLWSAHGVTADVLATGPEIGSYAPVLRDAGYRTGLLPMDPFHRFAPRFRRLLRDGGYDAIHNHEERANAYLAGIARSAGVRVVQSLHNLFDFTGAAALERRAMRAAMRAMGVMMVSVSEDVRAHEETVFGNPSEVIVNWYDPRDHSPTTPVQRAEARQVFGVEESTSVITSVGNCNRAKNHVTILQGLATMPGRDWVYLHAGTGPDVEAEQALATSLGIADRVRFLGFTPAPPVIRASDVFVMPSLVEGQGISAIEAVAAAVPVVLADTPGLRTLKGVHDALTWCAPTGESVGAAIAGVLADPPTADDLAGAADAVATAFSPEVGVAAFADLYKRGR